MERKGAKRFTILDLLEERGGKREGTSDAVSRESGVPAADVYGVATFYSLLDRPDVEVRVCQGLSCKMRGSDKLLFDIRAEGVSCEAVSCLGRCDRAPVAIGRDLDLARSGPMGSLSPADSTLPMDLAGHDDPTWPAFARAREMGAEAVLEAVKVSGLQGRGGAGFPTAFKWNAVRNHAETTRYVVVNADEGEPGTFKDRAVMVHRPHLMLEGTVIAAFVAGARDIWIYIRGEFPSARRAMEGAVKEATARGFLDGFIVRFIAGHGAYICGEETALLEAIEGKRGMPRLKPPYPTDQGLWGKPTLMNNVETLACVPYIVLHGGEQFADLGRTEPGSKLYCISGHIENPGTYELPLGVSLDELVEAAGGYVGTPFAFSPGGASSGFLPMSMRDRALDFKGLMEVGSMLGSAGVVVLNDTVDMAEAVLWQQVFFEDESCGQCTPCRVGCRVQRQAVTLFIETGDASALQNVDELAWEMDEGSICGLGIVASLPIQTAMKYFPERFGAGKGILREEKKG
jgi:NADH:ubiquinone oxidoreductase subunit F (NADH-binding)